MLPESWIKKNPNWDNPLPNSIDIYERMNQGQKSRVPASHVNKLRDEARKENSSVSEIQEGLKHIVWEEPVNKE